MLLARDWPRVGAFLSPTLLSPHAHTFHGARRREINAFTFNQNTAESSARSILTFYIADLCGLFERIMHIA